MPRRNPTDRLKARVIAEVTAIPPGRVTTYGAIAAQLRRTPREVARVLARFTEEESATVPWFRVVAAGGVVSTVKLGMVGQLQIQRLHEEGILVGPRHRIVDFEGVYWSRS